MKITMYELLGMVKDDKTPKRIIYDQFVYVWNKEDENYTREIDIGTSLNWDYIVINCLNEPVEILEEKEICHKCHKYPAEYNQTYCEFCLGISKLEEEKKIPEKLEILPDNEHYSNEVLYGKINEIIDYLYYLKSKGDE